MNVTYEYFCGLDWGNSEHQLCVIDREGTQIGERRAKATGEGISAAIDWLLKQAGGEGSRVAVIIERNDGPIVEALVDRGIHVFVIHPKQLDRFRDRHTASGAKDDRFDAFIAADAGRTDLKKLRRVQIATADLMMLRELSRLREDLMAEKLRLVEQMRSHLWRYFPQAVDLNAMDDLWFWTLLARYPTPAAIASAKRAAVASILKSHRVRRVTADEVVAALRSTPVKVADGVTEAASMRVRSILARLVPVRDELHRLERAIYALLSDSSASLTTASGESDGEAKGQKTEQRDVEIIRSLPGFGNHTAAALLVEAHEAIALRDYKALVTRNGVVPVTQQTGKQRSKNKRARSKAPPPKILMRQACNGRLREAMYHAGRTATQNDDRCKRLYDDARTRGVKHGAATRIVAAHLCRVLIAMLKSQTVFSTERHLSPCVRQAA